MTYRKGLLLGLLLIVASFSVVTIFKSQLGAERGSQELNDHRSVTSRLSSPVNLGQLTNAASIIVVGQVTELTPVGSYSSSKSDFRMSINVKKVLKGSVAASNIKVDFTRSPDRLSFTQTVRPLMFGILFLNPRPPASYTFADGNVEAIVAEASESNPQATVTADTKADAIDRVIGELGNVLASTTTSSEEKIEAIKIMSHVDSKAVNEALRRTVSSDHSVKLQAQAGLLKHNDLPTLLAVEKLLLDPNFKDIALPAIAAAIRDGRWSSDSVPALGHLVGAPDPQIRRAAVHALREIGSPEAEHAFFQGLSDSDQMVRYDSVLGLSTVKADQTHAPSIDTFKHSEAEYLTYWKQRAK